jgi:hypothetical protein
MSLKRKATVPARLYVLLARNAPVGVILLRGPSRWVQLIRWNTADDTLQPGQWFRGRIYRECCDLSPSGDKLIYFAAKHNKQQTADPTYTYAWTAISKVPYFTALALWPNGDIRFGGGLFGDENTVWLNSMGAISQYPPDLMPHPDHRPPDSVTIVPNPIAFLSDGTWLCYQYPDYARMLRDGWTWHKDGLQKVFDVLQPKDVRRQYLPRDLYRRIPKQGWWILHLRLPLIGVYKADKNESYFLHWGKSDTSTVEALDGVEWADWDQRGRLVCAREGKLYETLPTTASERLEWREIADFSKAKPYLMSPPDWAKTW